MKLSFFVLGAVIGAMITTKGAIADTPAACGLKLAFEQPDERDKKIIQRKVWTYNGNVLLFSSPLNVNTDGNPQSYPALHKFPSLSGLPARYNIICNGVTLRTAAGVYAGPDTDGGCGITNREVVRMGNKPTPWQVQPGDPRIKWVAMATVKSKDGDTIPCDAGNYYVSTTNIKSRPTKPDGSKWESCDQTQWLDSATIPAIVIPKESRFLSDYGVESGDCVVLFRPASPSRPERVVFAIVGDSGPAKKLGEATLAAHAKLVGGSVPKADDLDPAGNIVKQISLFGVKGTIVTIIFPKTAPKKGIRDDPQVNADRARTKLGEWLGGGQLDRALQWLRNCAS